MTIQEIEGQSDTEGSHQGPIECIRSTGVSGQFVTCTCDDSDDVRVWNCLGSTPTLLEVRKIGQLGNLGLCVGKSTKMLVVPGKSPELRVFKAKEAPNKRGEYLDKTWALKGGAFESRAAGLSECGEVVAATDGKTVFVWRLDEDEQKSELAITEKSDSEILAVDVMRPVSEDNYHEAYIVVAYAAGTSLHISAYKEVSKSEFAKIGEETVEDAHANKMKLVRLVMLEGRTVAMTVAYDRCIKLWAVPKEWLPRCSLMWLK